jgi:bilirubin oxidase
VVNVAAFESVVFRVVQSQLGLRMYHCHILEHEDQGMMGVLAVVA